jgi:hypothetical protein
MKTSILTLVLAGLAANSFSQDVLYRSNINSKELPSVVMEAIKTDFPDFSVKYSTANRLEHLEKAVLANKNMADKNDYDEYEIGLYGKNNNELMATYDKSGKLIGTMEKTKNITPPAEVRSALVKAYPGWIIEKDFYIAERGKGGKMKEQYKLLLTKNGTKMHVYTDADGNILKHSEIH